jgi:DNA-binding NtrC family response regulator
MIRHKLEDARKELDRVLNYPVQKIALLYLDDEKSNTRSFKALWRRSFDIFTANNCVEARDIIKQNKINLIIADQRMPDMMGIDFIKEVKKEFPEIRTIIYTANEQMVDNNLAIDLDTPIFSKPLSDYRMFNIINGKYQLI